MDRYHEATLGGTLSVDFAYFTSQFGGVELLLWGSPHRQMTPSHRDLITPEAPA